MGWAGLSELWGFPPIWEGLEVFLRRLHKINLWVPYFGCGDPPSFSVFRALQWLLPFCPLLMDFLCVWPLFIFECVLGACSQSEHLVFMFYIHTQHYTNHGCTAWWIFTNYTHPIYSLWSGEEIEHSQPLSVPAIPASAYLLQGRCLAWLSKA